MPKLTICHGHLGISSKHGYWKVIPCYCLPCHPTGISSQYLADQGINVPTLQSFFNYVLVAVVWGTVRLLWRKPLKQPIWIYAALAVVDVEANYLVTKAYQYTSLTSVTLLDCFTIPAVMVLSYCILRTRYQHAQYAAAALCVAGLGVLVASDRGSDEAGANPLLGDALVLLGACLYAVSNVLQERLLQDVPFQELLAMCGCFGAVFSGAQVAVLEHKALMELQWKVSSVGPLLAFALALFMFYSLVPRVLIWGGATVLNLSLLSSDVWAAAARILLFGGFGGTLPAFSVSLVMVSGGICMYACCEGDANGGEGQEGGKGHGVEHFQVQYNVLRDPEADVSPCLGEGDARAPSLELSPRASAC